MEFAQITNPVSTIISHSSLNGISITNTINENVTITEIPNVDIEAGKKYQLSFSITPLNQQGISQGVYWSQQYFDLYLGNPNEENYQFIKNFCVIKTANSQTNITSFTINFVSYDDFSQINIIAKDINDTKKFNLHSIELNQLENLFNDDTKKVIKVGVYGSSGSSFFINLDEIKLGKSGYYETTADIDNIYYFAVSPNSNIKTLDYLYIDNI